VQGAPAWWKALKPSAVDPETSYLATLNMMIPFLSPEDQRSVASTLYQANSKAFGHLSPEALGTAPTPPGELGQSTIDQFTSAAHYQSAMDALGSLMSATGKNEQDMGAGYRYLKSLLATGKQYGGAAGQSQTRGQYLQWLSALDPLLSQANSQELGAYAPLAKMVSSPFFSNGQLMPVTKTQNGQYIFGNPNATLF
jgi:hypothetical protein